MTLQPLPLSLGQDVVVYLDFANNSYRGIARAELGGAPFLVSGRGHPPFFRTPDGVSYGEFRFVGQRNEREETVVELDAVGRYMPVAEDVDMFDFPLLSTRTGEEVHDSLRIRFAPHSVEVGGESYRGFSVVYEWQSSERKIHWLLESVALAPGGTVAGTRLMAPNMTATAYPLEQVLELETAYSTAENYGSSCIEALCRGGGSLFFDLVQGPRGAVATYFEAFPADGRGALKANCQKAPGEDFVTSSDFHYAPLTGHFRSARRFVVASARAATSREECVNRWTSWFDFTGKLWRSRLGLPHSHAVPTLTFEGTGQGGVDPGMAYPELLENWAKRLDWVVEQGFRAINLHTPEWIGAANRRTVIFGGNNCSPWEFKLSDQLGGEAGLKAFCDACHARGVKVIIWIAGHLQREAPAWKRHPEWAMRSADKRLWDGHYGTIHGLSFTSGARQWIFEDLRNLREKTGVDGIWYDSFTGLSLGAVNWQSPDREPNAGAVLGFLSDLSGIGYEIMIECMTQLGVSSWGNLSPEQITGHEELLIDSNMRYYVRRQWELNPTLDRNLYFRMLASRAPIGVWAEEYMGHPEPFPFKLPDWHASLTRAYNVVEPMMERRVLFPEGALWHNSENVPAAFFAFQDVPRDAVILQGKSAQDLTAASSTAASSRLEAGHIYRLS